MKLDELKKQIEEKFEKTIGPWVAPFDTAMRFPRLIREVKSFLLQSLEEAYNLGEENMLEKVWDMIFDSFPADMENLSTMLPDQALRLMRKLTKKLYGLKEELNKP